MNKRRLLKLADLLEADAKNKKGIKFHMGHWGLYVGDKPEVSCGTSACAMGLAAISGAFRRQGLGYRAKFGSIDIKFKNRIGEIRAARRLFDLTENEANWLFMPSHYLPYGASIFDDDHPSYPKGSSGERIVAKRIRDFVAGKVFP